MLDPRCTPTFGIHGDEIEPVLVPLPPVPERPERRHPLDRALLEAAHALEPAAAGAAPPGLHFHESDQAAPADDQIRVVPADPEAMGLHRPAAGGQVRQREPFAVETEELALAGPLRDRSEAAGA